MGHYNNSSRSKRHFSMGIVLIIVLSLSVAGFTHTNPLKNTKLSVMQRSWSWMIAQSALNLLSTPVQQSLDSTTNYVISPPSTKGSAVSSTQSAVTYKSFIDFQAALQNHTVPQGTRWILLDLEKWQYTPLVEQKDPLKYYSMASDYAKRNGYGLIAAPGLSLFPGNFQQKLAYINRSNFYGKVAKYASIVEVQSQSLEFNESNFLSLVGTALTQAKTTDQNASVFAGLSTNPPAGVATSSQLLNLVNSAPIGLQGFWMNIPSPGEMCPNCNVQSPDVADEMFQALGI